MTAEEYLRQAYRLEQRIQLDLDELEELRSLSHSASSPGFEEHNNPNHPIDAPFVKILERIENREQKVNDEVNELMRLREEIQATINQLPDIDERLVLAYRYLKNWSWRAIGDELCADAHTIRRWHSNALEHLTVPVEE